MRSLLGRYGHANPRRQVRKQKFITIFVDGRKRQAIMAGLVSETPQRREKATSHQFINNESR